MMVRLISWAWVFAAVGLAQEALAPHSAFEPAAAKAAASLTASTKDARRDLLTTGEKSDWNQTAPYAEAVELARRFERASRFVKVLDIGATPEGRTMIAIVVSKERAFTPRAATKTSKAIVMIQSGIHAGEIEGKDTALMLVRTQIATLDEMKQALGNPVDVTVFRKLKPLDYLSSYSHRGRFYTLREIARFDDHGLWSQADAWFSRSGTLLATAEVFVNRSPRGFFADELARENQTS